MQLSRVTPPGMEPDAPLFARLFGAERPEATFSLATRHG